MLLGTIPQYGYTVIFDAQHYIPTLSVAIVIKLLMSDHFGDMINVMQNSQFNISLMLKDRTDT